MRLIDWHVGLRSSGRFAFGLGFVFLYDAMGPTAVSAQAIFSFRPSISTSQVYDSNLLFGASDRQSDLLTRVRPQLDAEYRLPLWLLSGRYGFDVERFVNHPELTSADARQDAAAGIEYRATERLLIATTAEFSRTRRPGELIPEMGLTFTPVSAQRLVGRSVITRRLNSAATSSVAYAFTEDRLAGYARIQTHAASLSTERRLSLRQSLTASYQLSRFLFGDTSSMSHGFKLGLSRAMTSRTSVSIGGGPIVTNTSPGLDAAILIRHRRRAADLSLSYARTQTTVFGVAGIVRTQSVSAPMTWHLPRDLRINIVPAFYQSVLDPLRADIYRLNIGGVWPISGRISFDASFDGSYQRGDLYRRLASRSIPRHEIILSVVVRSPQRRAPIPHSQQRPPSLD